MTQEKNNWEKVWNNRNTLMDKKNNILQKLIHANGFDSALGEMNESNWRRYIDVLMGRASLQKSDSIFEVGCGSGAFLLPFYEAGHIIGGLDFSKKLISLAQEVLPNAIKSISYGEANQLIEHPQYDILISNHVFHYFSTLSYAEKVLQVMIQKSKKTVILTALPDLALKKESEQARRDTLSIEEYQKKYNGLEILYFSKEWFEKIAVKHQAQVEFFQHEMPGFSQNQFRFDCHIKK